MKELHLKDKIILEKEEIINSLKLNFKDSKPLLTNFEYSPITDKMQNDNNQKRINSTTLSSKKLLAPPQVEPQKYYGPPSYLSSKSPKNDLSKKNKSDCYANNEEHQKESGVNIYEMRNTVKKVETLKNYKTFNQESFKSPYKIGFPSEKSNLSKSKINKENVHPSEFQASNHDFEKMNISEYLQINKNPKKIPITATIELFKLTEDKKNEEAITPKPILKNSSLEKSKS